MSGAGHMASAQSVNREGNCAIELSFHKPTEKKKIVIIIQQMKSYLKSVI